MDHDVTSMQLRQRTGVTIRGAQPHLVQAPTNRSHGHGRGCKANPDIVRYRASNRFQRVLFHAFQNVPRIHRGQDCQIILRKLFRRGRMEQPIESLHHLELRRFHLAGGKLGSGQADKNLRSRPLERGQLERQIQRRQSQEMQRVHGSFVRRNEFGQVPIENVHGHFDRVEGKVVVLDNFHGPFAQASAMMFGEHELLGLVVAAGCC
mmetsp:Transcript_24511/g.57490  ORF Transcript_24511/g.57490 Transcript_24511/m.57490 type:complete len:207 (-) Transcript_24511:290-910(-)